MPRAGHAIPLEDGASEERRAARSTLRPRKSIATTRLFFEPALCPYPSQRTQTPTDVVLLLLSLPTVGLPSHHTTPRPVIVERNDPHTQPAGGGGSIECLEVDLSGTTLQT
ncbi:hypothetical protein C8R46DRAFT_1220597 [Mycena filopes]|nr:hypothetical protein C8R46DRAFT_1220597 [Mycena filopes]